MTIKLISLVQGSLCRLEHDVELLLETQPAYSSDRVKVSGPVNDLPLEAVLDPQVLQVPDVLAQPSAVSQLPMPEGTIVTIQPSLERVSCQSSVVLLSIIIQSGDLTDIDDVLLR